MASRAKKPPGDESAPIPTRPARLRVTRPEVEEVLRSPRRGRPKLQQHKEDDNGAAPPRYDCSFQDEKEGGEFTPPQMVWCKVKSHPWWPAQVFDAADASELALQHARSGGGAPLVAYFWDKTFAWSDPSALLPFRANFARLASQNTIFNYVSSVDAALDEVERRVEAGLSCACVPNARKRQEVQNSGVREGAYGAVVDDVYMRDTFRGEPFLEYISALARNSLGGADRLDLATAKAQLRSFNQLRGPRELPEFVTFQGIEDVADTIEATPHIKRKRVEKTNNEDDVPSKEKKPRRGESSLRKRSAAKEDAVQEESPVPRKSSARKRTSKDVEKRESPAKKDAMVEDSSKLKISKSSEEKKKKKDSSKDKDKQPSLAEPAEEEAMGDDSSMLSGEATDGTFIKGRKSKVSKSSAKAKKKDITKDADKKESPPEPAEENATEDGSSTPTGGATDDTSSKGRMSKISKSSAKTKKKDVSKDADKKESLPEPAEEKATEDDRSTPTGGATDDTSSKGRMSNISKSSAKTKKKDVSKDADKESPAVEDTTNEESSMPSGEATDGTLSKGRKSKISKSSAKTEKKNISKGADKKDSLPEPAKEDATGDDSSTPEATDGTLSKERKSKISKSSAKKKKQDTSKDADVVETVGGSKTPVKKAVDGSVSESKSAHRLRSMHKTEDASQGPGKNDVAETTDGKGKDSALLKENKLGRRASSTRQKDKITSDGDGLADSSVKDPVSPGKKKSKLGETPVAKDAPISTSEIGRKKKKLSELMVETVTPSRSSGGKSKARGKHSLPVSAEKPDRDTEDTVKTRGKRSLPASAEKPERHTDDTVKTRGKRSLSALTEEPDRDVEVTKKTRGKRSLPAPAQKPEDADRDMKDKMKTRVKRSLPELPEGPDSDTKDTMKTRKRRKLDTLGDLSSRPPLSPKGSTKGREATPKASGKKSEASPAVKANGDSVGDSSSQPQPLTPKRSTKAREATRKAAELKPHPSPAELKAHASPPELKAHTSPAVKANGEASQTRSGRTKNSEETTVPDKSSHSVKPNNKGKKGATTEDSMSCGEMHSQLRLAASDLKKVGKITPASVSFFTEFSKNSCPASSDVEKEIPIEAANTDSYASSPHADKEMPEEAANKVASPSAEEQIPEKATNIVASPPADDEIPEKAANKVASRPADEEIPEKAANEVASPPADEEIPEKAADIVASPHADKEEPEKSTNEVASKDAGKEVPAKPTDIEPSPSEPPVAEHMKDDYWADILINVEEPISRLKTKKDKSKSKTSQTKELPAEAAAPKELPVSAGNVVVEEPKSAEPKQDNTENGKAKAKPPSVANGGQVDAEETVENQALVGLVMHFSRPDAVPSHSNLVKIFSQYGPVSEARTQTGNTANSATVIFKRRHDAEGAFGGVGHMTSILGPGLVSFRLTEFPGGAASGNGPRSEE